MIRGRQAKHCNATIALAMELHASGCCWKRIAQGLGDDIAQAVRDAKRHGMYKRQQ